MERDKFVTAEEAAALIDDGVTVGAAERARRMLAATKALLVRLDETDEA